jgi:hypothetical protein
VQPETAVQNDAPALESTRTTLLAIRPSQCAARHANEQAEATVNRAKVGTFDKQESTHHGVVKRLLNARESFDRRFFQAEPAKFREVLFKSFCPGSNMI